MMDENYENLKAVITALTQDYEKFKTKKVKAAGQRVRASLLNTKKLCDIIRKQVMEEIRAIPIKHRSEDVKEIIEEGANGTNEEAKPLEVVEEVKEVEEEEEKPKKRRRKANKPKEIKT